MNGRHDRQLYLLMEIIKGVVYWVVGICWFVRFLWNVSKFIYYIFVFGYLFEKFYNINYS